MPKDGNSTRKQLIYHALKLFKEHGYQNVSVKDICTAAEVQRGTFYYHFNNKEAIIDSFYEDIKIPSAYQSTIITTSNCWLKLWLLTKPAIDWTIEMGADILSTILIINLQNNCTTFFPVSEINSKKNIIDVIEHGQKIGHFHSKRSGLDLYHTIRNQILGICFTWCSQRGSFDEAKEIHDSLISILQVDESLISETADWI
jgi:AcrR family transcriptional regulator